MKPTALAIFIAGALIGGAVLYAGINSSNGSGDGAGAKNVALLDGIQVIEISARGGYHPQKSVAKAGLPTLVRFKTNGTYDCSSSVRIPSIGWSAFLPPSGAVNADLGVPQPGVVRGFCGMGMYSFEIEFKG